MKKIQFLLVILLSLSVIYSCTKENENPDVTDTEQENDSTNDSNGEDGNEEESEDSSNNDGQDGDDDDQEDSNEQSIVYGKGVKADGYTYTTIVLSTGTEWMAENLRTTKFANGDVIKNVTDQSEWKSLKDAKGSEESAAWCYYDNNEDYNNPYGKLYNWYAVNDERNICPDGWHVSTTAEWQELIEEAGGIIEAWGNLKATGTEYWRSPNYLATNSIGFSALPGGVRTSSKFDNITKHGFYWTANKSITGGHTFTTSYSLFTQTNMLTLYLFEYYGHSVRCVKD